LVDADIVAIDSLDAATSAMRLACHAPSPALPGARAPLASRARATASRPMPCAAPGRLGGVVARSSASRGALSARARGPARPRARPASLRVSAIGKLFGGAGSDDDSKSNVFAAKKRSAVRIPGLVVDVTPAEVADESAMRALEEVVKRGATAVILSDAEDGTSTRALFDAGLALKERLRGRAALFVADRTDIAASVEADGVVLGDDGVPVVVARKSIAGPAVVARAVRDENAALVAAKEGADLVLVRGGSEGGGSESKTTLDIVSAVASKISVPVFASLDETRLGDAGAVDALVAGGARGFALASAPRDANEWESVRGVLNAVAAVLNADDDDGAGQSVAADVEAAKANRAVSLSSSLASSASPTGLAGKLIDGASLALLERERALLDDAVAFLRSGAPELEEIDLLVEARRGLEELFLLVIVGEFNAGKSSVINAVLGERFLKEGILPTTNEITVLKYGDVNETKQSTDGFYTQTVPAELLKEVNIVDTPGTNVILERQQRLTEEFVPRADLVLFVLSADRPMTESEVKFLTYIKKWGKKVVFVVNKCDRLENREEIDEVAAFVADNAERLLGVADAAVMPVSAKAALAAKRTGAPLTNTGFVELEDYVLSFLGGGGEKSGSRGGEGMRLKLNTPLQVSELLFAAAEEILATERKAAAAEVAAATGVGDAMEAYADAMSEDFLAQLDAVRQCVLRSVARCDELLDSTLRLTNAAELFATYVLGNGGGGSIKRGYQAVVLGDARSELRAALAEHTGWLKRNNTNQLKAYEDAVRARGFDPEETDLGLGAVITAEPEEERLEAEGNSGDAEDGETRRDETSDEETVKTLADVVEEEEASATTTSLSAADLVRRRYSAADETSALTVAASFDHVSAAALLEEEVKSAVYATVGAAGGAFFVAVFLSGFLDSLAEDVLAFSLTAAVGYVSVLSLPLKRAETKAKVRAAAEDLLAETEKAMRAEFERKTLAATRQVLATVAPWSRAAVETETEIAANQAKRDALQQALDALRRDVQSL
jgi:small GTP-binding protein